MALPTFQDMLAQTNPNGVSFGGGTTGLTVDSSPGLNGATTGSGGTTTNTGGGTATGGGLTATSGGGTAAGLAAYLQAAQGATGMLQDQLGAIPTALASSEAGIQSQANDQLQSLGTQFNSGQTANQRAQVDLDNSNNRSLSQLGDQLRGMYNNYMGQLGAAGAGSSSAADLVKYALGQQGTQGQFNLGTQNASQQTGLNQNVANLHQNFQDQSQAINDWKTQQMSAIAQQYQQQRQMLENQIASAQTDEARTAMYEQDAAAANQALAALQATVASAGSATQQLQQQFQQAAHNVPQSQLDAQGYAVQNFTAPQVAGLSYQNNAAQAPAQSQVVAKLNNTGINLPGTIASVS